jgi:beta-phosphoglucomutase-like phosphatase (HAD superfamily)
MQERYAPERTVMVGDAPGDMEAAHAVGALFFPILPGAEDASWIELREEGIERVLSGTFAGVYQDNLIARFNAVLSDTPPWRRD